MITTQTFLTGLFYRFQVKDPDIQTQFSRLYGPLISHILEVSPQSLRVALFRDLFSQIRSTLKILTEIKTKTGQIPEETISLALPLILFSQNMVDQVVTLSPNSYQSFRQIVNQAFIDDLTCDIGHLLSTFKSSKSLRQKIAAKVQLEIVLNDYNMAQGSLLTVRDLLSPAKV